MKITVGMLGKLDSDIFTYYSNGLKMWFELLKNEDYKNEKSLADKLDYISFEHNCGGRHLGQEIMLTSIIGMFSNQYGEFTEGCDETEKIKFILNAIIKSHSSFEVKHAAKNYIEFYGLNYK